MNSWTASAGGGSQKKLCELCKEEAFVYCFADAAFLCLNCDAKVHHANFLVARHLRHFLCSKCKSPFCHKKQPTFLASQAQTKTTHLCKACCSPENNPMSPSSSDCLSSSCESSSTDLKHKRITKANTTHSSSTSASEVTISNSSNDNNSKNRLEGIFVIWCKKLGLSRLDVVPKASAVLRLCLERLTGLPFMVSLAAAFWAGLRMSGAQRSVATWQILKQLGNLSGVPAKLIVAVEPKLARAMRLRKKRIRQDLEEGWAECNV